MIIPKVLKNFNLFVDGNGFAGLVEQVTLPKLSLKMSDIYNGGMDAPIDLEMGMDKLECSFSLSEYNADIIKQFGLRNGAQVSLTMRGGLDAENGVVPVIVKLTGAWKDLDMGSWKPGEKAPLNANVTLRYYKLTIGTEDLVEVDVVNMVRVIDGVDQLAEMRTAIGL
ncbi:phage major tail tube protein [Marinibactrum halimedae]|uniref:Phage major tail tube protein n=1 Tax=Marinibactrum halimedae TaxID=1444977 RepID=A0AA37TCM8_9GAMM|nr:phage major tail tube protein [Marinibactrum halimedae]MCD9460783.1 phage major tail tube protein [Marinibactrum halimedae]GLS27370.1 phage major tail tube protein [Marinibactrum halimedae]